MRNRLQLAYAVWNIVIGSANMSVGLFVHVQLPIKMATGHEKDRISAPLSILYIFSSYL